MASVTLNPSADCYLVSDAPTTNTGTQTSLAVGEINGSTSVRRALLKFDLSSIPAEITAATLRMYDDGSDFSANTRTMFVNRSKRAWVETQATWNQYSSGNNWATAGGGTNAADVDFTAVGSISMPDSPVVGYVDITLTASLVEAMRTGSFTNNGFMLSMGTESNDAHIFNSREGANPPQLVVTYPSSDGSPMFFSGGVTLA